MRSLFSEKEGGKAAGKGTLCGAAALPPLPKPLVPLRTRLRRAWNAVSAASAWLGASPTPDEGL